MLDDFGGEVGRRAYSCGDEFWGVVNDFAHAQVSYFDLSLFCEKDILQFDVSVDDAFLM